MGTVPAVKVMILPSTLSVEPPVIRFAVVSEVVALLMVTVPVVEPVALVRPKNFRTSLLPWIVVVPPGGDAIENSPAVVMVLWVPLVRVVKVAAPAEMATVLSPLAMSIALRTSVTVAVVVVPVPR